LRPVAH